MTFHRINEDPFYDDDGNLVDEDADLLENMKDAADLARDRDGWSTVDTSIPEDELAAFKREATEACYIMDCDPYSTINS